MRIKKLYRLLKKFSASLPSLNKIALDSQKSLRGCVAILNKIAKKKGLALSCARLPYSLIIIIELKIVAPLAAAALFRGAALN